MPDPAPRSLWPALRRRLPRFAFALTARLDGTWREVESFMRDHQIGLFETLERVRRDRLSLARFGEGELALALGISIVYQQDSAELQSELRAILRGEGCAGLPLLVCIPGVNVAYYRQYWPKYWSLIGPLLNPACRYGNTSVSREGLFRLDAERARLAWRAIWEGADVCFVIGKGSRFEPIDALFDGIASQRTLYSLPRDAYADVPRLIDEIVATVPRETLILASLGPAATVLAVRLAPLGYRVLDIGHISNAYRTVAFGARPAERSPLIATG
ncbi:MAG: DUF1792 domain-containing protein [Burkholderiaceae bacterium]|nr:DUF1792 domain-containing protein [Burkholderiaceae bacterium]